MESKTVLGITYSKPKVILLQESGLGTSELAGRTAYNSFGKSEHHSIATLGDALEFSEIAPHLSIVDEKIEEFNAVHSSELLTSLAWVKHHYSVLEHCSLTYLIKGTSRGVLQEHARHRIQSLTVQSTRYTMSPIINAFLAEVEINQANTVPSQWFMDKMQELDFLVTDEFYNVLEIKTIWDKLKYQKSLDSTAFYDASMSKDMVTNNALTYTTAEEVFNALQSCKQRRNVGDSFKHLVTDNWKVDMVVTFNLRSLKNYFTLRDSGAAFFGIQLLAEEMKKATPSKYLDLIVKKQKQP